MMRLVLASKPMDEIDENSSNCEIKNQTKNISKNHENKKHCNTR
jgi:hypothetical protein